MTMKEAMDGGFPTEATTEFPEGLPREATETEVRHLAYGASPTTLCGVDRAAVSTVHPSKARRMDCEACRDALRTCKANGKVAKTSDALVDAAHRDDDMKMVTGNHVEFPADGSAWIVEDVRSGGVDLKCLLSGSYYKRGATTTVGATSSVRIFKPGEFEALVDEGPRKAAEAAKIQAEKLGAAAPSLTLPSAKGWKPTSADVAEVKRLRLLGHSYIQIESDMGWAVGHGNRPWRIDKGLLKPRD